MDNEGSARLKGELRETFVVAVSAVATDFF